MTAPLLKFPSINQFKQTLTSIKKLGIKDSIKFIGTVKLHGTNGAIGYSEKYGLWVQSRRQIITSENDNYNFAKWVDSKNKDIVEMMKRLGHYYKIDLSENSIIIYGEYCGGKIQRGVAINGLDLMFVVFDAATTADNEESLRWLDIQNLTFVNNIYNIYQFQTYSIDVDLNNLSQTKNQLILLTNQVEKECPVGKYFGKELGKDCTTGEGIVWRCSYKLGNDNIKIIRFKVKGDEHATSKVKTMTGDSEMVTNIKDFVEKSVTENRLNQGISEIFGNKEADNSWFDSIGKFNRWVINDVKKEDMSAFPYLDDYEGKNGEEKQKETEKLLSKEITKKSTKWFRSYVKN